jgi:hypothetical protein
VTLSSRVSPNARETVVVSGCDELPIVGEIYIVDVCAISSSGEDPVHQPAEFGIIGRPESPRCVACAIGVLLEGGTREEEELMSAAHRSDVLSVCAPVN